ncbi:MAG: DNA phosphorothioation-associated putative methyltransferase, partial [Chloroflexota bacterium]
MSVTVHPKPDNETVKRSLTAIKRGSLSRPVGLALVDGLLPSGASYFDYGCGHGGDLQRLAALGYEVAGWDPEHRPDADRRAADVVNLGYVVNVIEDPSERADALRAAWSLARSVLIVSARLDYEARTVSGREYSDGLITTRGTFQKFFTQEELRAWIDTTLGVRSITAAPGIFYVFRDDLIAQSYLASRVRHRPVAVRRPRVSEAMYEANREILDPLVAFVESRGRYPEAFELQQAQAIIERFGSIKAALSVVRRVTGDENWQAARVRASEDLTVYLALAAFRGRPKSTQLPADLQLDVKAFFGSYREACAAADDLLFSVGNQASIDRACRESTVGKLTREALYVHISALPRLAPLLRVYEGCGRALTGTVDHANIIKLNRIEPKITYLAYPDFDRDPHPALTVSVRADLRRLDIKYRDFRDSPNPPILHRKETFVAPDYPWREKF